MPKPHDHVARRNMYDIRPAAQLSEVRDMVVAWHYAGGMSNTFVHADVLIDRATGAAVGAAVWLPPTKVAAVSVAGEGWRDVVALTRLVVAPGCPTNTASILLGASMRRVPARWRTFVTYADSRQGHTGTIYRATNWVYLGERPGDPLWTDPTTGQQVARKATTSRTAAQMRALGLMRQPGVPKHKFAFWRDGMPEGMVAVVAP